MTFTKMTDRSVAASCLLGSVSLRGTGLSAISADKPALLATLPVSERNERPTKALVAVAGAQQAHGAYGPAAAAGAGFKQTTTQHHLMWAFRGLEPWSDPA
ncbi:MULTISPECIES: hypothetical protein [Streptomyces]|uniref:Uncharacterized protein n=1 Tax=Streptomyces katrae TaxID=68223 RepID=A0A0F4J8F9_9ACTN|nr:hypothetical protein [Streptomyces katrae]KJY30074.1 hypothetical protein VR44_21335 [Streptomyces katrae]